MQLADHTTMQPAQEGSLVLDYSKRGAPACELPGGKAGRGDVQACPQQLALAQPLLGVLQRVAQALEGRSYPVGEGWPKLLVRLLADLGRVGRSGGA